MSRLDAETRARLHVLLDRLVDQAEQAENDLRPPPAETAENSSVGIGHVLNALLQAPEPPAEVPAWIANPILVDGMKLLRDAVGPAVLKGAFDRPARNSSERRSLLRSWIWTLHPLLDRGLFFGGSQGLKVYDVLDGLSALDAGEIQPLFRAETGRNRRANRWTLARCKLEALIWKKRLKALGMNEKHANHQITVAFGEQWDTVRKWQGQCSRILGQTHVLSMLGFAAGPSDPYLHGTRGLLGSRPPLDYEKGLSDDGRRYREELNKAASLGSPKSDG